MQLGDEITVHSIKYDGSPHRWWRSHIIRADDCGLLLHTPNGTLMNGPKGGWQSRGGNTFFWWDRWYNVYQAPDDSTTLRYYVHIATPPALSAGQLVYIDLDVDVIMDITGRVRVEDEDEFATGTVRYGYSDEVIRRVQEATHQVRQLFTQSQSPWNELL